MSTTEPTVDPTIDPAIDPTSHRRGRRGCESKISNGDLLQMHAEHLASPELTIPELGRRNYRHLGYSSPASCARAIRTSFRRLGLAPRDGRSIRRKMSDDDVRGAWLMHAEDGLSVWEVAGEIWRRYGYSCPEACYISLREFFAREGLHARETGRAPVVLPVSALLTLHAMYRDGCTIETIAAGAYQLLGFPTIEACAASILDGFATHDLRLVLSA